MKVAIVHQDLEFSEVSIMERLGHLGHVGILVDVRTVEARDLAGFDLVLNRVYASVANRAFYDNLRALSLLEELEAMGVRCVNSLRATRFDYDKHRAAEALRAEGIPTPETLLIMEPEDLERQRARMREWGYPLVVKRNMGGRAKDLVKVGDEAELLASLRPRLGEDARREYGAGFVVQPFLRSTCDHDQRICVVVDRCIHAFGRSLVGLRAGEPPWVGSIGKGSVLVPYEPSAEVLDLAFRTTEIIGAELNEVDLITTADGPVVIEVNPTPAFVPEDVPGKIDEVLTLLLANEPPSSRIGVRDES